MVGSLAAADFEAGFVRAVQSGADVSVEQGSDRARVCVQRELDGLTQQKAPLSIDCSNTVLFIPSSYLCRLRKVTHALFAY